MTEGGLQRGETLEEERGFLRERAGSRERKRRKRRKKCLGKGVEC